VSDSISLGPYRLEPIAERNKEGKILLVHEWIAYDAQGREIAEVSSPWPCSGKKLIGILDEHRLQRYPREILNGVRQ